MIHPKILNILISTVVVAVLAYQIIQYTVDDNYGAQMLNVAALVFATIVLVGCVTSDLPLAARPRTILAGASSSGGKVYDMEALAAPRVEGNLLKCASFLLKNGWIGHLGRRPLINLNGTEEMRDLANQAGQRSIPATFYPLVRSNPRTKDEKLFTVTDTMAATATTALQKGLARSYDNTRVVGIMDYHEAYKAKSVTPTQQLFRVLEAMDQLEDMHIFVEVNRDDIVEQAKASDQRWEQGKPLSVFDGVPIAVKDAILVKGYTKSENTPVRKSDKPSQVDDIMVKRFRDAGAIIVGTTTMTQFGRCPLGYNSHSRGPYNPHDKSCYSGGSSVGSICAVMCGIVPVAISLDGGGSIRLPAALSGGFGLAATFGRIPSNADDAFVSGNFHPGTNTATTTDTALAYALLAQNKLDHHYAQWFDGGRQGPPRPHLTDFDRIEDLTDLRIGVYWDYFLDCDPEIAKRCKETLHMFENRGAKIVDVTIPHLNAMDMAHGFTISMEMSFLQDRDFWNRDDLEPATMIQLAMASSMSGVEFLAASRIRGWALDYFQRLFTQIDVFITPGCPITAPKISKGALSNGDLDMGLMAVVMRFIFITNLVGTPGISVPVAYAENGLPISLHMMAAHWNDALLLRLSNFVEQKCFQRQDPKHFVKIKLK